MPEARDIVLLKHMAEDVADVRSFIAGVNYAEFSQSSLLKKAVSMSLLNIGELAREMSDEIKTESPTIPWRSIVGLSNRAAHGYHSLDPRILWEIATHQMDPLQDVIKCLLK